MSGTLELLLKDIGRWKSWFLLVSLRSKARRLLEDALMAERRRAEVEAQGRRKLEQEIEAEKQRVEDERRRKIEEAEMAARLDEEKRLEEELEAARRRAEEEARLAAQRTEDLAAVHCVIPTQRRAALPTLLRLLQGDQASTLMIPCANDLRNADVQLFHTLRFQSHLEYPVLMALGSLVLLTLLLGCLAVEGAELYFSGIV
ncbi:unnamed protein product [Durusdinium trenchii]|uniref:Uncharacterized protein n=1 Tax=Durusdinium trenchii TaxID=1381693 RepID=A0ABP0I944_9DINO